jgi:hypothetical protein
VAVVVIVPRPGVDVSLSEEDLSTLPIDEKDVFRGTVVVKEEFGSLMTDELPVCEVVERRACAGLPRGCESKNLWSFLGGRDRRLDLDPP